MTIEANTKHGDPIVLASLESGAESSEIEIMPVGEVRHSGEKKPFFVSDPEALIRASFQDLPNGMSELAIDFDHSSDKPDVNKTRQSTRAAGWISKMEVRDGKVIATVDWTPVGRAAVEGREYRSISPVFQVRKSDRQIVRITRAALTNTPAIRELSRIASDPTEEGEQGMSLARIAKALGLAEDAAEDVVLASAATVIAKASQLDTVLEAAGHEGEVTDEAIATVTASLKAEGGEPDPSKFVSMTEYTKLAAEVATLTKDTATDKAEAAVTAALKGGKITPAMKDVATKLASSDLKAFNDWIATMPTFVTDGEVISGVKAAKVDGQLTEAQKTVCASMGLSEDAYLATLSGNAPEKKEA
ncbi:phage protease [Tropicimonas sp. S265A]|uniref:phage protease n=1 Tax=Tropicimonas sp. S265A TaxID=3415134 RepID=UPI003C7DD62C